MWNQYRAKVVAHNINRLHFKTEDGEKLEWQFEKPNGRIDGLRRGDIVKFHAMERGKKDNSKVISNINWKTFPIR